MRSVLGYLSPYVRSLEKERDRFMHLSLQLLGVKLETEEEQAAAASGNGGATRPKATEPIQAQPMTMPQAMRALSDASYVEHYGPAAAEAEAGGKETSQA